MKKEIKSIDTFYSGYRFRSRLEARWAVFLDNLRIKWEYEPEGFELSDGRRYLPDFYIPQFSGGFYMEVKPDNFDFGSPDAKTVIDFARQKKTRILLAVGSPNCTLFKMYSEEIEDFDIACECVDLVLPGFMDVYFCDEYLIDEHRFFYDPGDESFASREQNPRVFEAVHASRSARFEHGESGGGK